MRYPNFAAWRQRMESDSKLPEGFQTSVTGLEFTPGEKPGLSPQAMNLALLRLEEPTASFAAMFTRNTFTGWPVVVGRELLDAPAVHGVLVNNRVANVGVQNGLFDSKRLSGGLAGILGDGAPYFPSSTGVIGWRLPVDEMEAALPLLADNLTADSILPFAEAIMTTDSWPKVRSSACGPGRIVGTAKGAGMVEPNMATMLVFLITDVRIPRESARRILGDVVQETFNRISIDGETSTSDSVMLLASGRKPYPGDEMFSRQLHRVAASLADDVVRNGEGCSHVFRVELSGAPDSRTALALAKAIANAPLTKSAIRGNDPNIGRILQALGAACGRLELDTHREGMSLEIGGRRVYADGSFCLDAATERVLGDYFREKSLPLPAPKWPLHDERVEIAVRLDCGTASAAVIGSDLSEDYVRINSDYRT